MLRLITQPRMRCADVARHEAEVLGDDTALTAAAMQAAGEGIGYAILEDYCELKSFPSDPRILVLAGSGFNAGDAFHAARVLCQECSQARVAVLFASDPDRLKPLAAEALAQLEADLTAVEKHVLAGEGEDLEELAAQSWTVVLDGLLGMTFRPPLRDAYRRVIEWANQDLASVRFRAAVDLPSGLGDEAGEAVFRADFSYATGVVKAPLLDAGPAESRIRWVPVPQIPPPETASKRKVVLPASLSSLSQLRSAQADKRSFGHALILAGSSSMPGAGLMATMAAVRSGAGLVTAMMPGDIGAQMAPMVPEAMWQQVPVNVEGSLEADVVRLIHRSAERASALLIGPGLKADRSSLHSVCRMIRECPLPLVLDAGALNPEAMSAIVSRPKRCGPIIITPHWGEYQRLRGQPMDAFDPDELLQFCRKHRLIALLKGPVTRICDGEVLLDVPVGGPVLARGGSGDLLAGILVSLLGQHPEQALEAAAMSVLWQGAAADLWARERGQVAVRTTELLDYLSPALRLA